jgi:hypothetical protein
MNIYNVDVVLNMPDLQDVKESEGDGEDAEEEVGYGQGGYEDVL